jgi:hypothetical protein
MNFGTRDSRVVCVPCLRFFLKCKIWRFQLHQVEYTNYIPYYQTLHYLLVRDNVLSVLF